MIENAKHNHNVQHEVCRPVVRPQIQTGAEMRGTPTAIIQSFLADPAEPCWSSYAIDCLFSELQGDTKAKLQQILPQIDERLNEVSHSLTDTQANFLRDVTVRNFVDKTSTPFTADQLSWLIHRFDAMPTPQRALIMALLISPEELGLETSAAINALLSGTPGERWLN